LLVVNFVKKQQLSNVMFWLKAEANQLFLDFMFSLFLFVLELEKIEKCLNVKNLG